MHKRTKSRTSVWPPFFNRTDRQKTGLSGQKPDTWQPYPKHVKTRNTK